MSSSGVQGLWSRDFRAWFLARGCAVLAAEIAIIVLQLLVLESGGSATAVAALRAGVTLPYLIFGPLAGAVADRTRRRRMMITSDLLAGKLLLAAAIWTIFAEPHVAILVCATFLVWSALVFFEAASWGSILTIVGKEKLGQANSKIWALLSIAGLAGPLIAASLASATTLTFVLFLASGLYFASASFVLSVKAIRRQEGSAGPKPRALDGIRLLVRYEGLRNLVGVMSSVSFAMGAGTAVLVVYLTEPEQAGTYLDIGLVFSAGAGGALLASVIFPVLREKVGTRPVMAIGPLLYSGSLVVFALVDHVVLLLLVWGLAHLLYTILVLNSITVRQEATPAEEQGRVNTSARVVTLSMMLIGTLSGGVIADLAGPEASYFMAASVAAFLGTALVVTSWRFLGTVDPPT